MAVNPMEQHRESRPPGDAALVLQIIGEIDDRFLAGDSELPNLQAVFTEAAGRVSLRRDVADPRHATLVVLDNQR
jgi:hypothetical protein